MFVEVWLGTKLCRHVTVISVCPGVFEKKEHNNNYIFKEKYGMCSMHMKRKGQTSGKFVELFFKLIQIKEITELLQTGNVHECKKD